MYKKLSIVTATAALLLAGGAFADNRGAVPGVDVDSNATADVNLKAPLADKNSDGKITRTEAAGNAELVKAFGKLDMNRDGSLDMAEYAKFEATAKSTGGITSNRGDEAPNKNNVPGTVDDSTPGNKDLPGPRR